MTISVLISIIIAFAAPLTLGMLVLRFSHRFSKGQKKRSDNLAPQASHRGNPIRIGGLLVMLGCFMSAATIANQSEGRFIISILFSALPVFIAGLIEDMGYFVRPVIRLIAAFMSSSLTVYLTSFVITSVELPYLDIIFGCFPLAALITIFCAGIFSHSLNIVDGLNGLAAQVIICTAIGLAIIGFQIDFKQLAAFCIILTFATISFGYFNWPHAKIFLGDAGSYGIGHILIWIGISYLGTDKSIAFPAIILVLYWPIADITHTVGRRLLAGKNIFQPDNQHIHQKTKRLLAKLLSKRFARRYANPLGSLFLLPMIAFPPFVGVVLLTQPIFAWMAVVLFFLGFIVVYQIISRYERVFTDV